MMTRSDQDPASPGLEQAIQDGHVAVTTDVGSVVKADVAMQISSVLETLKDEHGLSEATAQRAVLGYLAGRQEE